LSPNNRKHKAAQTTIYNSGNDIEEKNRRTKQDNKSHETKEEEKEMSIIIH
jgi:hypothetical protein